MNKDRITDKAILAATSAVMVFICGVFFNLIIVLAGYNKFIHPGTAYVFCAAVSIVLFVVEMVYLFNVAQLDKQPFPMKDVTDMAKMFEQLSRTRQQERKEESLANQPAGQPVDVPVVSDYSQQVFDARQRAQALLDSGTSNNSGPKMLN